MRSASVTYRTAEDSSRGSAENSEAHSASSRSQTPFTRCRARAALDGLPTSWMVASGYAERSEASTGVVRIRSPTAPDLKIRMDRGGCVDIGIGRNNIGARGDASRKIYRCNPSFFRTQLADLIAWTVTTASVAEQSWMRADRSTS